MITGQSTATVLTTGAIAAPVLMAPAAFPRPKVAAIIAMSAIYGMIAPPISLPTMIMGSGVDMPFTGFDLPAARWPRCRWPSASTWAWRGSTCSASTWTPCCPNWARTTPRRYGVRLFLPLVLVAVLLIGIRLVPALSANLGIALVFLIGAAVGTRDRAAVQPVPQPPSARSARRCR